MRTLPVSHSSSMFLKNPLLRCVTMVIPKPREARGGVRCSNRQSRKATRRHREKQSKVEVLKTHLPTSLVSKSGQKLQ